VTVWLVLGALAAFGGLTVWLLRRGERLGRAAAEKDVMQGELDDVRKAEEVRRGVDRMHDGDVAGRLRRWTRPK
jgi:hypothetical protein